MAQSADQFISTASRLIPEYDGTASNLQSFLDGIEMVDELKGEHERLAVTLIKTKLKGTARQIITTENSILAIINALKTNIKGESVAVLTAKLMNLQQKNKTANQYTKEVEQLTKAIQGAYISDGIPPKIAIQYSTKASVDAMVKNCTLPEVRLIMKSGQFNNLNDAVQKFVESCTDATGRTDTVLFTQRQNTNNYRENNRVNGNFRGRGYYRNNNYNRQRQYNNSNQYGNQRGRGNNRRIQHNVRITSTNNGTNQNNIGSENLNQPLRD
ncbi:homeobox protein 4-like [Teleopsis dalmanni]|uniref:homeobox protein 4-like n=1 Tax=Teleopsis dalmanni TaxID=139649 RepID=UPI0018CFEB47|nr:homeobox protein 4-like [Teleopsis dalmanni]